MILKTIYTFLNLRYLITVVASLGSQSSKLKRLHLRHAHEFLFDDWPELLLRRILLSASGDKDRRTSSSS